jgi:hypothetical protein
MRDPLFMFCRAQEWQREQEQMHLLLAEVRKIHRASFWQHILGRLSALFMTPRASEMTPRASEQKCNTSIPLEAVVVSEEEKLTQNGFTSEEIVALDRYRQWYQTGGREDIVILRHWEFLKLLVNNGKLEV